MTELSGSSTCAVAYLSLKENLCWVLATTVRSFARAAPREDLLITTDLMIEGVHFRREEASPAFIGHKSLARGLSDIAAMGGEPKFCLVSLAIPKTWQRHVDEFYRGLLRLARQSNTQVAGGDMSKADRIAIDIIVCGAVKKGMALRRDGAAPGDSIYVSGALGRSAARGYRLRPRAAAASWDVRCADGPVPVWI